MTAYQYTDSTEQVVHVIDDDGISRMSMLASAVPEGAQILPAEPEPDPIPDVCTPAQGLVALFALKSITEADIQAAIEGIPDQVDRYTAQIAFNKATEWRRESPSVQMLASLMSLTETDLDNLFTYAVGVQV